MTLGRTDVEATREAVRGRRRGRWALLVLPALLLSGGPASAQQTTTPDEQARRLLEDGRAYRKEGKVKQALDNFNTIVTGFPTSDSVDDALLEIGRYHLEVEGDTAKAREAFDLVTKRYPQSDGAPGAYYYLGVLAMASASTAAELDDPIAQFNRVQRLYPRSDWVPRALYALGMAHRKAGRLADAIEWQRRVSLEYPASEAAAGAQFQIGHLLALQGEYRLAMEEFQQVRNRFPESEWGPRALERTTALYRLYGGAKPTFTIDTGFSAGAGEMLKDVRALLMTPQRTLWIASDKVKSALPLDAAGKVGPSMGGEDLRTLTLSPRGDVVLAAKAAVRIGPKDVRTFAMPGDKPGVMQPLDEISAAAVTQAGMILVADSGRKKVLRYDARFEYKGPFPDAKPREVTRIVCDAEGGILFLDREAKSIQAFDETGKPLWTLPFKGTGYELRRPGDISVDPLRNLYVVDEEGSVVVFGPQRQVLLVLSGEEMKKPRALTLDPAGAVLVYDDKLQRVLRFK